MPEISRFLGIVIYMFFNDHNPPHFHVGYNEYQASVLIETFGLIEGRLPPPGVESGCRVGQPASSGVDRKLGEHKVERRVSPD